MRNPRRPLIAPKPQPPRRGVLVELSIRNGIPFIYLCEDEQDQKPWSERSALMQEWMDAWTKIIAAAPTTGVLTRLTQVVDERIRHPDNITAISQELGRRTRAMQGFPS
jgi:hypothetical protein